MSLVVEVSDLREWGVDAWFELGPYEIETTGFTLSIPKEDTLGIGPNCCIQIPEDG